MQQKELKEKEGTVYQEEFIDAGLELLKVVGSWVSRKAVNPQG